MISGATFPDGSSLGLFLTKEDGSSAYDTPYDNVQYTSSTSSGNQIWTATPDPILLTGTKANVYAYYPYDDSYSDITAIPIDVTENRDVMWATPATNIYNANPTAPLSMNHALSVIRFSLSKGDYSGAGSIESISIQGDCMAKTGTLNAKTGTVNITDQGAEIDFGTLGAAATLSTTATTVEQLVIPTTASGPIKVTIQMDGKTFEATSSAFVGTESSKAYKFGLAFSDSRLTMSTVSIGTIAEEDKGSMTPIVGGVATITWAEAKSTDGVYGIYEGKPAQYSEAEKASELDGVAIVMYGRALQISNNQLESQVWGDTSTDIVGIDNRTMVGGGVSDYYGYLPQADGSYHSGLYNITQTYDLWPNTANSALADTAGWSHTEVLISKQSTSSYLGPKTKAFRKNASANQGFPDWFVPAAGQLAYIYLNMTKINLLLQKISGAIQIPANTLRSSSEYSSRDAWIVGFNDGSVRNGNSKGSQCYVRFCRDITE